jgi:pimeloyl-ACP methyl ester carboxylesterase
LNRSLVWRRIRRIWITTGLALTALFVAWSVIAYRASPEARAALRSDAMVAVTRGADRWTVAPVDTGAMLHVHLLFLPGGLVDPVAYAPLARAAAASGFATTILELPRRGAFGGATDPALFDRAHAILSDTKRGERWVVAGHSRGAVIASRLASERPAALAGLVLIGSSHPRDVSLAAATYPVLKIVGDRDGLASPDEVRANAGLLPPATRWLRITGANHSQFGWYGFQPGDRFARISADEQHAATVDGVIGLLLSVAASVPVSTAPPLRAP